MWGSRQELRLWVVDKRTEAHLPFVRSAFTFDRFVACRWITDGAPGVISGRSTAPYVDVRFGHIDELGKLEDVVRVLPHSAHGSEPRTSERSAVKPIITISTSI